MFFKDKVTLYIIVIVVGAVFLELAVFVLAVFLVLGFVLGYRACQEYGNFNNTFETLGASLPYLEHIIGLKNAYLYDG